MDIESENILHKNLIDLVQELQHFGLNKIRLIKTPEHDHFGFMAVLFLQRQISHGSSIIRLMPSRDTMTVARSMIEGLFHLAWASFDHKRAEDWKAYSFVHDWKLSKEKNTQGNFFNSAEIDEILKNIEKHGDRFLKKNGKNLVDGGNRADLTANHYHSDFLGSVKFPDILKEANDERLTSLYYSLYVGYSDWSHWGTGSIGNSIKREKNHIIYDHNNFAYSTSSLICSFLCIHTILDMVNSHFQLDLDKSLNSLTDKFISKLPQAQPIQI